MQKSKVFHVISNTHWDREWRFPYQRNRQMLVEMMDEVLQILETEPDYRAYHLDSQSIMVKDYLEARPGKKEQLIKFVEQKRLFIGPWYTLPDQYMVGGENLVRNLLRGHEVSAQYGGVSKIGYTPFSWGQISQLPQLYRQFGVHLIMFYRGINSLDSPKAEFIWQGADGTKALSSRFSTWPRYNFYFYIYRPVVHGEMPADIEQTWNEGGTPFHFADPEQVEEDYFMSRFKDGYTEENIRDSVQNIISDQADDFTTKHVIWMEGHDSSGPNAKTVKLLKDIKNEFPELDVRHSTLEDYAKALAEEADTNSLPVVNGERRSAQFDRNSSNLYGYALSARMYLKQANFNTERWLQYVAEPMNSLMGLCQMDIFDRYPEMAWDLLIQNSAHDSIGGCSLDRIHEDMMMRFQHAEEISRGMTDRAIRHLAQQIDLSDSPEESIYLVVVNTTLFARNEITEAFVDVPKTVDKGSIKLIDKNGGELPFQLIERTYVQPVLEQMINRPMYYDMVRYNLWLKTGDVPGMGFNTIRVEPVQETGKLHPNIGLKDEGLPVLENEHLTITFNDNGTFNITDKHRDRTFSNQGWIFDEGEAGHAWVHEAIAPFVDTRNSLPNITVAENGPLSATVKIEHILQLSPSLSHRKSKSGATVDVPVIIRISLNSGQKWPEINVETDNRAESHRMRMMFPLGLNADYSFGEGQYDVVPRSTNRIDSIDWIEQPMYDYPMHHFVDVSNDDEGVAVLVDGLKEYEVLDDAEQTLAITLFRSFEYRIPVSSDVDYSHMKGTQCLGKQKFRMAFYPHRGNWRTGDVYREAFAFNYNLRLFETGRTEGTIKPGSSFITVDSPDLIFSCFKKAEGDFVNENGETGSGLKFVLRLFNPADHNTKGVIELFKEIKKAELITLEEVNVSDIKVENGNTFNISAKPKEIVSVRLTF